jgi:transposase
MSHPKLRSTTHRLGSSTNPRFSNDALGWADLRAKIAAYPHLGVAIETSCGPAVERLLELGLTVYPVNPKAAERFRDRKSPAGVKNDALDAWCFADALRPTEMRDIRRPGTR